jgi:hypothetical protein
MNEGFEKLRKLTKAKNKEECQKLLEASLDKNSFIKYIENFLNDENFYSNIDFSEFNEPLSEGEYKQLHHKYHYPLLWKALGEQRFSDYNALNPEIWLSVTMQAIKNDIIKPGYLAFDPSKENSHGLNEIEIAIESLKDESIVGKKNTPMWLQVSRTILRHMFGAIQERGIKGIFQDVPFAMAWRRMSLAKNVSKNTGIYEIKIVKFLLDNPTIYNDLIEKMGGQLTVIADRNIRDGIFKYIFSDEYDMKKKDDFKKLTKRIGIESTWRGMGILSSDENKEIIGKLKI